MQFVGALLFVLGLAGMVLAGSSEIGVSSALVPGGRIVNEGLMADRAMKMNASGFLVVAGAVLIRKEKA